ncbi:hypothetical protein C8J57DRAFT_1632438 [Mycena rebaudengoi]|nr:hypothetical protein C8J57DRAFT_1632438 [Mycena rebaudengoi]
MSSSAPTSPGPRCRLRCCAAVRYRVWVYEWDWDRDQHRDGHARDEPWVPGPSWAAHQPVARRRRDGADVIPLPQILDGAVYNSPPLPPSPYPSRPSCTRTRPTAPLLVLSLLSLPPPAHEHPRLSFIPFPFCPARSSSATPIRPLRPVLIFPLSSGLPHLPYTSHTNSLPPAPDLPPNTPAYLAACSGVSNATLGKILPTVMMREIDIMEARGNGPTYPTQFGGALDERPAVSPRECCRRSVVFVAVGVVCGSETTTEQLLDETMTPAEEMTRLSSQRMDRQDMEFVASLCGLSSCSYIDAASTIAVLLLAGTGFSTGCSDGEAATLAKLLAR